MQKVHPSAASLPTEAKQNTSNDSNLRETEPSAARLAVAIAGYPYSARAAVMDIVDNSVENGAASIAVLLRSGNDALVVADNGTGVAPEIIDEALRPGSYTADRYSPNSLSRYGIGLKGAGLSLGRRIVVLTRWSGEPLRRRAIDMDVIQNEDRWVQEIREPNNEEIALFERTMDEVGARPKDVSTGTIVIIEKLNIRSRDKARIRRDIIRACGETYARFLSRQLPEESRLRIKVDDQEISAFDPLHREDKRTTLLYNREELRMDDGSVLYFSAVVLPHPNQVDAETKTQYRYSQDNQGIYVYRNNRLIASGQTFGLFGRDFHLNAFRAEITYLSEADHHILVDVAKSGVLLSPEASSKIQDYVVNCTKTANALWRDHDVLTPEDIQGLFDESNRLIASRIKLLPTKRLSPKTGQVEGGKGNGTPKATPTKPASSKQEIPYLIKVPHLPDGVLYRPRLKEGVVVVEVNLSHPFSKAVFSGTATESQNKVPRKATTAVQQLIYILGSTEYTFPEDHLALFAEFRKHASVNLSGLLAD